MRTKGEAKIIFMFFIAFHGLKYFDVNLLKIWSKQSEKTLQIITFYKMGFHALNVSNSFIIYLNKLKTLIDSCAATGCWQVFINALLSFSECYSLQLRERLWRSEFVYSYLMSSNII